ncbi:serine/threonine-protein kinase [Ramlibacter humi]|uniref:non-specific serine/threonine protein kinase n=1 Tax=Ramlibacter humi TaxID=2530451 RepID=A0A4Z0BCM6_9BURK|nr:serine/threonine-protein kinase [Ramlibacter humi]TFY97026.1 serine/threonine protein kinase [Ramlibacter humi]
MAARLLGRYELRRLVGKGAMGQVYEAWDPNLDRPVAIKTVRMDRLSDAEAREFEARLRVEARSAARLQHPNIVTLYDTGREDSAAFLVLEYVDGDDLQRHLAVRRRLGLAQAAQIMQGLLAALGYAHSRGVIHRDVKPANMLLPAEGGVKLTDFGVARLQGSGEATFTKHGVLLGTARYMAPEQLKGLRLDGRADIFAAGIVLYEMLAGLRPFSGDNEFAMMHSILTHEPQSLCLLRPDLPGRLDRVVARALAKDRDERYATAELFAADLRLAVADDEDLTLPPAEWAAAPRAAV